MIRFYHLVCRFCDHAGAGTSMLECQLTTALPLTSLAETIDTIRIHSIAGFTSGSTAFVTTRSLRATHHTILDGGLIGGS